MNKVELKETYVKQRSKENFYDPSFPILLCRRRTLACVSHPGLPLPPLSNSLLLWKPKTFASSPKPSPASWLIHIFKWETGQSWAIWCQPSAFIRSESSQCLEAMWVCRQWSGEMAWRKGQWGCNKYRRLAACLPIPERETPNHKGQFLLKLPPCENTPFYFSCTRRVRTHRHRHIIPKCASQNTSDQLQPFSHGWAVSKMPHFIIGWPLTLQVQI